MSPSKISNYDHKKSNKRKLLDCKLNLDVNMNQPFSQILPNAPKWKNFDSLREKFSARLSNNYDYDKWYKDVKKISGLCSFFKTQTFKL
jgi:hypothetical protein